MQNENAPFFNGLGYIGWRYYNQIKKKAMDKKPGVTGLLLSMSIAFFIVIAGAEALSISYKLYSGEEIRAVNLIKNIPAKSAPVQKNVSSFIACAKSKFSTNIAQAANEEKWQQIFKYLYNNK